MIRQSRQIWRKAHPVRLPSKDTPPHLELEAAYLRDLRRIEEELALQIEEEFEEMA
jgi:hypothetical protein